MTLKNVHELIENIYFFYTIHIQCCICNCIGLSARARTVFRIVTALAPPFVMESELDEDGLCLRGLPCHRLSPNGQHNLTLMFNAIETRDRLREDAVEHGVKPPQDNSNTYDHSLYEYVYKKKKLF